MPHWTAWLEMTFGVLLLGVSAAHWQHGGRTTAALALLFLSSAVRDLLPGNLWWVRVPLWIAAVGLLAWAAIRTPREAYVRARVELALGTSVVALIVLLQLAPLPQIVEIPLLVLMSVLFVACMLRLLARSLRTPV